MRTEHISKRETTAIKIELASRTIREENDRRRKHNEKREALLKKSKAAPEALPLLRPAFFHIARRTAKRVPLYTKGVHTVVNSNKHLCGRLGALCKVLKAAMLPYPWLEDDA